VFIGFRSDLGIEPISPKITHSKLALEWDQGESGTYWARHKVSPRKRQPPLLFSDNLSPWVTTRDAIAQIEGPMARVSDRVSLEHGQHVFIPGARSYAGHEGSLLDWPAKALKAGVHGVPGGENMLRMENGKTRYFTIREAAT